MDTIPGPGRQDVYVCPFDKTVDYRLLRSLSEILNLLKLSCENTIKRKWSLKRFVLPNYSLLFWIPFCGRGIVKFSDNLKMQANNVTSLLRWLKEIHGKKQWKSFFLRSRKGLCNVGWGGHPLERKGISEVRVTSPVMSLVPYWHKKRKARISQSLLQGFMTSLVKFRSQKHCYPQCQVEFSVLMFWIFCFVLNSQHSWWNKKLDVGYQAAQFDPGL